MLRCAGWLLLGGLLAEGCSRPPTTEAERPRPVKITTTQRASTLQKEFVGLSTPDDAVNLAFKIGGQIQTIPVSKGRAVERGALIAELDPKEVELQVDADLTAYQEASSQLQRMKRLLAHEAISMQEYEAATTRHAQAKAAYENARALLQDTKIRAPFQGVIEATYVDAFQRVAAGEAIARLVNPRTTTVSFTIPERSLYLLEQPETRFWVRFDNYPGKVFPARLKNFARTSTDASGFPTSLTLYDLDWERYPIAPGMSCMISMQIADPVAGAVSLPISAIYAPASGGTWVWVVNAQNRVERHAVRLGDLLGSDRVVIDSGLRADERVVTAGIYRLHEGEAVSIIHP